MDPGCRMTFVLLLVAILSVTTFELHRPPRDPDIESILRSRLMKRDLNVEKISNNSPNSLKNKQDDSADLDSDSTKSPSTLDMANDEPTSTKKGKGRGKGKSTTTETTTTIETTTEIITTTPATMTTADVTESPTTASDDSTSPSGVSMDGLQTLTTEAQTIANTAVSGSGNAVVSTDSTTKKPTPGCPSKPAVCQVGEVTSDTSIPMCSQVKGDLIFNEKSDALSDAMMKKFLCITSVQGSVVIDGINRTNFDFLSNLKSIKGDGEEPALTVRNTKSSIDLTSLTIFECKGTKKVHIDVSSNVKMSKELKDYLAGSEPPLVESDQQEMMEKKEREGTFTIILNSTIAVIVVLAIIAMVLVVVLLRINAKLKKLVKANKKSMSKEGSKSSMSQVDSVATNSKLGDSDPTKSKAAGAEAESLMNDKPIPEIF